MTQTVNDTEAASSSGRCFSEFSVLALVAGALVVSGLLWAIIFMVL